MTAYEQIKNSIEMTALVRAVVTGNPEEVSLMDLKEEEYNQFKNIYLRKPYKAARAMNSFLKRMNNQDVKNRHVVSAVNLECLVETEALKSAVKDKEETDVIPGIKEFLGNGYTEMCMELKNTGREYQEKFRVDKRSIAGILAKCRAIAVDSEDDYSALCEIAGLVANTMQYNQNEVEKIWKRSRDETVMIQNYTEQEVAVCRQYAVLMQLGLQEAGIKSKLQIGLGKDNVGHIWGMAETSKGFTLVDTASVKPFVVSGAYETECYESARKQGWNDFIVLNGKRHHFSKYSTKGLTE